MSQQEKSMKSEVKACADDQITFAEELRALLDQAQRATEQQPAELRAQLSTFLRVGG